MVGVAPGRRGRLLVGALTGLAALMLLAAPAASAHAVLQSSTPTAGAVLRSGEKPARVELRFDEPVEASLGAIQVVAGDGSRVDTATVSHPSGAGGRVAVALRGRLAEGSYLVVWRVVSADSHPVHGSFTFALGHPGAVGSAPASDAGRPLAVALGVARFAGYGGLLLLVGAVVFLAVCAPALRSDPVARRLLFAAVALTAAATVAGFALQAAFDVGGGWSRALDPVTLRALLGTRLGHAHALRLVLLGALWVLVLRAGAVSRLRGVMVALGLAGVLATVAAEGHSGRTLSAAALDVAHLAAAGAWLGGLVVLLIVVLPAHRRELRRPDRVPLPPPDPRAPRGGAPVAVLERVSVERQPWLPVRRFSAVALGSVAVLAGTGVAQALRQVPEWGALTGTTYGRLLLVKVALVGVTLAVAAVSRNAVRTRLAGSTNERRVRVLTRTVAAETVLLTAVLAVTSALVASMPAGAAYRPGQERSVQAGPITLELTALNSAPRTLEVHLYAFGTDGRPADVTDIRAEAAQTGNGGLGPVTIPLLHAGTGHFLSGELLLPHAGSWTLTLVVHTGKFDADTATTTLKVR